MGNLLDASFNYSENIEYRIAELKQNMRRSRTEAGIQYGSTHDAILEMKLYVVSESKSMLITQELSPFYQGLKSDDEYYFTVLYNREVAKKKAGKKEIKTHEGGFIAKGFVVAIDEEYDEDNLSVEGAYDRLLLTVRIQLSEVCYLGENNQNNKTIRIFA